MSTSESLVELTQFVKLLRIVNTFCPAALRRKKFQTAKDFRLKSLTFISVQIVEGRSRESAIRSSYSETDSSGDDPATGKKFLCVHQQVS